MTRGHNFKPHLLFPWVDEIVHAPEVLDAVEDLIGPDIRLFHLSVWPKDPGTGTYVSWHQDATYFALDPVCHVTAWVALTDAPVEAGCMEVVPGSHKLGQLRHADMQDTDNLLSRGQTLAADVDRSRTAYMAVKAGQFSLHHTHLVHNSRPNRSHASPRRARHQLHPDPCALHHADPRDGDAGARPRQLQQLRRRAPAAGRGRSRGTRLPCRGRRHFPPSRSNAESCRELTRG